MTVKEFKEQLSTLDDNLEVFTTILDCTSNVNELTTLGFSRISEEEFEDEDGTTFKGCYLVNDFIELLQSNED